MILSHNGDEVRAQDLPDTALELRKQQMEEYKEIPVNDIRIALNKLTDEVPK